MLSNNSFSAVTPAMQKTANLNIIRKYRIIKHIVFDRHFPNFILYGAVSSVELMGIWKSCDLLDSAVKFIQQISRCRAAAITSSWLNRSAFSTASISASRSLL